MPGGACSRPAATPSTPPSPRRGRCACASPAARAWAVRPSPWCAAAASPSPSTATPTRPGASPAPLGHLHRRFGGLPAEQVLAPAIALADGGYEISPLQHRQLRWCRSALAATSGARGFLDDGRPYVSGQTFRQPALARCLRRLASEGVEDFYRGEVARAIDRDMRRHGGVLGLDDLAGFAGPHELEPLVFSYRGRQVSTIPAPGGGPQLAHALATLEQLDPSAWRARPEA